MTDLHAASAAPGAADATGRIRNIVMSAHKWGGDGRTPNFRKIRATLIAKHPEVIAKAFGGDANRAAGWIKARWYQLRGRPVPGTRGSGHNLSGDDAPVIRLTGVTSADLLAVTRDGRPKIRIRTSDPGLLALGWLPASVKESTLDDGDFAVVYMDGETQVRKLPYKIHGKVNEAGWRAAWSMAAKTHLPSGTSLDAVRKRLLASKPKGIEVSAK